MKKRRTLIIAILLIAALCLGIGYAALARDMTISSTANLNPDNGDFALIFADAKATSDIEGAATASVTGDKSTANYTITGLSKPGEKVTLTFVIENQTSDISAQLTGVTSTPGTLTVAKDGQQLDGGNVVDWFDKVVTITDPDGHDHTVANASNIILDPGEKATVTIVVTLKQTVVEPTTLTGATVMFSWNGTKYVPNP